MFKGSWKFGRSFGLSDAEGQKILKIRAEFWYFLTRKRPRRAFYSGRVLELADTERSKYLENSVLFNTEKVQRIQKIRA
jgi:hypothetical protein